MSATAPRLERVRVTRVGVGVVLVTLIVGMAAVNTGNNALYLVESVLLALLVVTGFASRRNLRRLQLAVDPPEEAYAQQPVSLAFRLTNRDRRLTRRWLTLAADRQGRGSAVPYLEGGESRAGRLDLLFERRGRHRLRFVRLGSLFPLGLFQKVMRYPIDLEVLVYPELYPVTGDPRRERGQSGERPSRRRGWGHELLALRGFREGDDPRGIHWKRSARTGDLVFMEREAERGRRMSILLDNGIGRGGGEAARRRFERLVSEAASAAVRQLERGCEVELVTRDGSVPFGAGRAQRRRLLERLALIEPCAVGAAPLRAGDPSAPAMRLGFRAEEAAG